MTTTMTRSGRREAGGGFGSLLRAEWTKFRTVRGWVIAMLVAAGLFTGIGVWAANGPNVGCGFVTPGSPGGNGPATCSRNLPVGPDGEAVTDAFTFLHKPLTGNGGVTAQVASLSGLYSNSAGMGRADDPEEGWPSGVQPWAKAGVIIKATGHQGSAYAAMMITGTHGVRMQDDYTHDTAGTPGPVSAAAPRWLRLTRSGDTITGYDSADGVHWTRVGTVRLSGLSTTVRAGLFVTSPPVVTAHTSAPSLATATFRDANVSGQGTVWRDSEVGPPTGLSVGSHQAAGRFTLSGSGDIAPAVPGGEGGSKPADLGLNGAFAGLIVVIVVGAMVMTAEYRRGLIRTTLAATPRRGRVLAAKALVVGMVTFAVSLVGIAVPVVLGGHLLRDNGNAVFPMSAATEVRVLAGTAAAFALAAVLALALGVAMRSSAGSITAVVALLVLPFFFAGPFAVLPTGAANWLLRVTPAAAFSIQQVVPAYPQVNDAYAAGNGFYPLAPWAGFGVLCAWTALALGLALVLLRRRDA